MNRILRLEQIWPWLASGLSGILLALCFAPWNLGNLVWVWSWPLLAALWFAPGSESLSTKERILRGLWLGYLAGFVFFCINSHWIFHTGKVVQRVSAGVGAVIGMGLYLGLYVGLFGIFAATAGRLRLPDPPDRQSDSGEKKIGVFPNPFSRKTGRDLFGQSWAVLQAAFLNGACWCGLEWLRAVMFTGYSWNSLGVALSEHLMLIQFADVIGQLGYGFVLMFCGVVGFGTIFRFQREIRAQQGMRPHLDFAVAAAMVIALFLYGFRRVTEPSGETVNFDVRIIQMNTSIEEKYSASEEVRDQIVWDYRDLTRAFLDHKTQDIVIWPETALPTVFSMPTTFRFFDNEILKGEDYYLIMGIEDNDVEGRIFNTITVLKGEAKSFQQYSKIHLVPFGEFVPGRDWKLPVFEWVFGKVITQDFTRGKSYENLFVEKDGHRVGVMPLVCFEDTVARHARRFVRFDLPQFMVNVTNDAWFYDSAEPHQHFSNAIFRCIELRRPMVRAANTGVSGFIDVRGSVFDRDSPEEFKRIIQDEETGNTFIRGSLPGVLRVGLNQPMTVYARIGDAFSVGMGIFGLVFFGVWCLRIRGRRR